MDDRNITSSNFDYDMYSGAGAKDLMAEYERMQQQEKKDAAGKKREDYENRFSGMSSDELFSQPRTASRRYDSFLTGTEGSDFDRELEEDFSQAQEAAEPMEEMKRRRMQAYAEVDAMFHKNSQQSDNSQDSDFLQQNGVFNDPYRGQQPPGYGRRNPDTGYGSNLQGDSSQDSDFLQQNGVFNDPYKGQQPPGYGRRNSDTGYDGGYLQSNGGSVMPQQDPQMYRRQQAVAEVSAMLDMHRTTPSKSSTSAKRQQPPGYGKRNPDASPQQLDPEKYERYMHGLEESQRILAHGRAMMYNEELNRQRRRNAGRGFYGLGRRRGAYLTDDEQNELDKAFLWYGLWFLAGIGIARALELSYSLYAILGACLGYVGAIVKHNGLEKMPLADAAANSRKELAGIGAAIVLTIIYTYV